MRPASLMLCWLIVLCFAISQAKAAPLRLETGVPDNPTAATSSPTSPASPADAKPMINSIYSEGEPNSSILLIRPKTFLDKAELRFEWPENVAYRALSQPGRLLLDFDQDAYTLPPVIDDSLRPFVSTITHDTLAGHLLVTLSLPKDVVPTHRREGNQIVVSLRKDNAAKESAEASPEKPVPLLPLQPADKNTREEAKPKPPTKDQPKLSFAKTPDLPALPRFKPKAPAPPKETAKADKETVAKDSKKPAEKPSKPEDKAIAATDSAAIPASIRARMEAARPKSTGTLKPIVTVGNGAVEVEFPWEEPTGAAIFSRDDTVWVLFDRKAPFDVKQVGSDNPYIADFRAHPQDKALGFSMRNLTGLPVAVSKRGEHWVVTFANPAVKPLPIRIEIKKHPEAGNYLFLPMMFASTPVLFDDPKIGETLVVVPIRLPGYGISPERQFVEFALLESMQGVVMQRYDEQVSLMPQDKGLRISGPFGLLIGDNIPSATAYDDLLETGSFFPADRWKAPVLQDPTANGFMTAKGMLQKETSKALDTGDVNMMRKRLAQLYMAEGLYLEAGLVIKNIANSEPDFYIGHRLSALEGMALFMRDRYRAAGDALARPELDNFPETAFWRKMATLAQKQMPDPLELSNEEKELLKNYPVEVQRKLALLMAEKFITDKNYNEAVNLLEPMRQAKQLDQASENLTLYYFGKIAEETGRPEKALELWTPLTQQYDDPLNRFQAQLAITDLQLKNQKITSDEAIKQLEGLRLVWRYSEQERELLQKLGQLYVDNGKPVDGLRVWRELVKEYPGTAQAKYASVQMEDQFIKLFNRGGADNFTPLKALALYFEFSNLTPLGTEGDIMIQKLADRLVEVDLLTRAAALLTHQVRYRVGDLDRVRVGARLAWIHLQNNKPELALDALRTTENLDIDVPLSLKSMRRYLKAQALQELGKLQDALGLVAQDDSPEAQLISMEILWKMEQWQLLTGYLQRMLRNTPTDAPLTPRDAEVVMRLALAQQFNGENAAAEATGKKYKALMDATPYAENFDFITRDLGRIDHKDMSKLDTLIGSFSTFVQDFSKEVGQKGLSEAVQ